MLKRDKKGEVLIEQVIEYSITALVLVALIVTVLPLIYGAFSGGKGDVEKAKMWINYISDKLNSLEEGERLNIVAFAPQKWGLIYFEEDQTNKYAKRPEGVCFSSCLCICKPKLYGGYDCGVGACRAVLKNAAVEENIEFYSDLTLKLYDGDFRITTSKQEILPITLTESLIAKLEKCNLAFKDKGYEGFVEKASEESKVEETKIKSISCQESNVIANAVSTAGAAGVMQLMPCTGRGLGLKVPKNTYEISIVNGKEVCTNLNYCTVSKKENCDYGNDERFNPEKNILAGTKHLASLEKQYDSFDVVLAAYNWGGGNLQKNCPEFNLGECQLPEETEDYVGRVLAFQKYFAENV